MTPTIDTQEARMGELEIIARALQPKCFGQGDIPRLIANELAETAIAALRDAGFAIVPVEPTTNAALRGQAAIFNDPGVSPEGELPSERCWRAMLTAHQQEVERHRDGGQP